MWPLYIPTKSGGSAISWIAFTNSSDYDLTGLFSWINPSSARSKYYPNGFTNECYAIGSSYTSSSSLQNYTNILANGVNLYDTISDSKPPKIKISSKNGTFKFSAKDSATNKKLSYSGVIFQKLDAGYGMYLDTDQTSKPVVISP